MAFDRELPYNELPLLPPKAEIEDLKILHRAANAREALAELKGSCVIIPNPKMLIDTLVLQEAKASSAVENIVTTSEKLYTTAASSLHTKGDTAAKEVLRYRKALWRGYKNLKDKRKFDEEFFFNIVSNIIEDCDGIRDIRKSDTIHVSNNVSHEIIYTPPEGVKIIRAKLRNLSDYLNYKKSSVDPLVRLAVAHYQFEAIHPFVDGNGRTGRIINSLFLVKEGLLELPILYLSKYINENKRSYHKLIKGVTERGAWAPWIMFNIEAIEETAKHTLLKINMIKKTLDETIEKVRRKAPKIYSKELVEQLFFQPYCKIATLVDHGVAARNAAGRYLHELTRIGILKKHTVGKENLYLNVKLFKVLQE